MSVGLESMSNADLLEWANSIDNRLTFREEVDWFNKLPCVVVGDWRKPHITLQAGHRFRPSAGGGAYVRFDFKSMEAPHYHACSGGYDDMDRLAEVILVYAERWNLMDEQPRLF